MVVLGGHIAASECSTAAGPERAARQRPPDCTERLEAEGVRGQKGGECEGKSGGCICGQVRVGMHRWSGGGAVVQVWSNGRFIGLSAGRLRWVPEFVMRVGP